MKVKKLNHEMEHEEFMGSVSRANPSLHYLPCMEDHQWQNSTIGDRVNIIGSSYILKFLFNN